MNLSIQTATSRSPLAAPEQASGVVYRNRFAQRRLARAYPPTQGADKILRNRRLGAGSLLTYRD
ncbi:MAG: hypothetical protein H0V62_13600 [Gammaproteobacteria bacterium]|nr:hypothetical protein [Gammaproteobacteria bacterium]